MQRFVYLDLWRIYFCERGYVGYLILIVGLNGMVRFVLSTADSRISSSVCPAKAVYLLFISSLGK